jgi:hypothetical protein
VSQSQCRCALVSHDVIASCHTCRLPPAAHKEDMETYMFSKRNVA